MGRSYKYQSYAVFYGIPCYFGEAKGEYHLRGRNRFYDFMIIPAVWLHNFFCMIGELLIPQWESEGFPIRIEDDISEELAQQLELEEDESQP